MSARMLVIDYTAMIDVERGLFTVGVFQDVAWARKGIEALKLAGFPSNSFSIIAKDSPDRAALVEQTCGSAADRLEVAIVGQVLARGPLVDALEGLGRDLAKLGLARSMR